MFADFRQAFRALHTSRGFSALVTVVLAVMLLAAYVPVRRATTVDSIVALRTE